MCCAAASTDPPRVNEEALQVGESLAGATVQSLTAVKRGGNSRIFCLETAAERFALKVYPERGADTRDRGDVEWRALQFLRARGLAAVPRPLARDPTGRFLLMEWVDGVPVAEHDASDLAQAADFVAAVFALSSHPEATSLPLASEACLSAGEIVRQIEERLPRLTLEPALSRFLGQSFVPLLAKAKAAAASEPQYGTSLPMELRRLIPADFGFHNALRQADGSLRFVDFEYFGWDDPAKLTADFVLHPAMKLGVEDRCYFVDRMAAALPRDRFFRDRLKRLVPLFALRWMLILLNPFRSDRAAEQTAKGDRRDGLLKDRLEKARALCECAEGGAEALGQVPISGPRPRSAVAPPG